MHGVSKLARRTASAAPGFIVDLAEVGPEDALLVGRKAFHLGALLRHGFDVPRGFCVTTEAFRHAASVGDEEPGLPWSLREAIVAAWRRARLRVAAVRSSATEEDGDDSSWAGVFPTVLPVRDEEGLLAAVLSCFRALHAPGAELYRHSRHGGRQPPAMAVLVQSLVDARAAGLVFTANPVTGARNEIIVNAVRGLAEPLCAGRVSGDVFVACRQGAIKTRSVSAKPFMLTCAGEVALPPGEGKRPAMSGDEVAALTRLAVKVEALFGCPQDIEFAIAGDRIHLVQARPITGPSEGAAIGAGEAERYLERERAKLGDRVDALRGQGRLRGGDAIFSNGNVGELLPTPTPMSFGLFRSIFAGHGGAIVAGRRTLGYRLAEDAAEGLYESICGQIYFNVEIDAGVFDIGLPVDVESILARLAEQPDRANYPEFGLYCQSMSLAGVAARHGEVEGRRRHGVIWRFHAAMVAKGRAIRRSFPNDIEPLLRLSLNTARPDERDAGDDALLAAFNQRLDYLRRFACAWFVVAARLAFFFADMVPWRLEHHLGDASLAGPLLQGLDGSIVTRQALDLENLAQGRMTRDAFLRTYGHGSSNELEIALPRLEDDPAVIERLLRDLAVAGRRPQREFRAQQRRRRATETDLRRLLAAAGAGAAETRALFADLRLAQTFLPLRETIKHYYTGEYRALRRILLEINRRLCWADDDVFYLDPAELGGCFRTREALALKVRQRRRERRIAALLAGQRRVPAVVFASDMRAIGARAGGPQARHLTGMPVAPGKAAGRVRLLDESAPLSSWTEMCGDEIIVARSANLGLAPLLRVAVGLVVEVGGVLAHAACQARESGIPAVVLAGATGVLRDGMAISIDGDTGHIHVLDDEAAAP
jgi:pyruvate,water dikinase